MRRQLPAIFVNPREPVTEYHGLFPVSERTWFRHERRWEVLKSGHLRHFNICHYGFYHVRFVKVGRDQELKDDEKLPHVDLYRDERARRLQPQLVPLEEYCANHPGAHGLPHPSRVGIVAPQRPHRLVVHSFIACLITSSASRSSQNNSPDSGMGWGHRNRELMSATRKTKRTIK